MIKLKYSNQEYAMVGSFNFDKSSREVKYGNISIDFTGLTTSDLPRKYQECQIVDGDEIIYTGYANSYSLNTDMKREDDDYRQLDIELLSPMSLATVRTVLLKGTYQLDELVKLIVKPLINDGFILKELNVSDKTVSVNFIIKTVEESLNKLSNDHNFWWYIDEKKNIYINDISYQFSKDVVLTYDGLPPAGLYKIEPTIDIEDYCNVINIKNVRVYSSSITYDNNKLNSIIDVNKINKDDEITFSQPIDITLKNVIKSYNELKESISAYNIGDYPPAIYIEGTTSTGTKTMYIRLKDGQLEYSSNIKMNDDDEEKEFELTKDSFFSTLVTGFKYTGDQAITITKVISISCLKWTNVKFYNNVEIEKQKEIISRSGQIEKTIDLNEQWKLMSEVNTIAKSYIDVNSGDVNTLKLTFDRKKKIDVGDIVEVNKPKFLLDYAKYICTDISYTYNRANSEVYTYELRNKNYLTSYIDLFRSKDEETSTDKIETIAITNYIVEEMKEIHEVV